MSYKKYMVIGDHDSLIFLSKQFPQKISLNFQTENPHIFLKNSKLWKCTLPLTQEEYEEILSAIRELFSQQCTVGIRSVTFKPRAVFFDMDDTVTKGESINALAHRYGQEHKILPITTTAMKGGLEFAESLRQRIAFLKGMSHAEVLSSVKNIEFQPGIKELMQSFMKEKIPAFLISGGFQEFASSVATQLSFADYEANHLEYKEGILTGSVLNPIIDRKAKADYVQRICKKLSITPAETIAVGDGANDIEMLALSGLGIGFKAKAVLYPHIHLLNHLGDYGVLEFFLS